MLEQLLGVDVDAGVAEAANGVVAFREVALVAR